MSAAMTGLQTDQSEGSRKWCRKDARGYSDSVQMHDGSCCFSASFLSNVWSHAAWWRTPPDRRGPSSFFWSFQISCWAVIGYRAMLWPLTSGLPARLRLWRCSQNMFVFPLWRVHTGHVMDQLFLPGVVRWSGPMKNLLLDVNTGFCDTPQKKKSCLFVTTADTVTFSFSRVTWMHHLQCQVRQDWDQWGVYIRVLYHSDVSESWWLVLYLMNRVYFDPSATVLSLTLLSHKKTD